MEQQQSGHHHSGHQHGALIQTLLDCGRLSEECVAACLHESDLAKMAHCIEVDRDCADICFLAAKLLMRDSEVAHKFLVVCEEACRICAEECSKHNDQHCQRCAESCRKCAEACHQHHGQVQMS